MKKYLIALLSVVILLSCIACSGSGEDFSFDYDDSSNSNYDFNNYEFVLKGFSNPDYGDSTIGDMILENYKRVEKLFNVDLVLETGESQFSGNLLIKSLAGEKYADLIYSGIENIFPCYRANLIYPLNDNGFFDITEYRFGRPAVKGPVKFDGENYYGVYPELWPTLGMSINGHVLINYQMIRELNQPSPYELLESGKWVWDTFEELAKAGTNAAEGTYGVSTDHDEMINTVMFSNGCSYVSFNEKTQKYEFGFATDQAIEAAEWVKKLVDEKLVYHWTQSARTPDTSQLVFSDGKSMFHIGPGYYGIQQEGLPLEEGFGFIPMAFGYSNPDQNWNIKYDMRQAYVCLPSVAGCDPDMSLPVLSSLLEEIEGAPSWQDYYTKYVFTDDKAAEMYIAMVDVATDSYFYVWGFSRVHLDAANSIMINNASPREVLKALESRSQAQLDEIMNQ